MPMIGESGTTEYGLLSNRTSALTWTSNCADGLVGWECSNCSGAQAQPRATARRRSASPTGAGPKASDRRAHEFRNHMRGKLFAFDGAPGKSLFCRWVNDPREPDELPLDWTPDEAAVA